jgi:hypothetical protein
MRKRMRASRRRSKKGRKIERREIRKEGKRGKG